MPRLRVIAYVDGFNLVADMKIRAERPSDRDAIFSVNARAFESDAEARFVDILRDRSAVTVSLVAELDGVVVGHILFSPVRVGERSFVALAPMSVAPENQRSGIGSALVRAGIDACRARGDAAIFGRERLDARARGARRRA